MVGSVVLALASVRVSEGVGGQRNQTTTPFLPGDDPRAFASVVALLWAGVLTLAAVRHLRAQGWALRIRAP